MNWIFTGGRRDNGSIPALARDFWAGTDLANTFPRPIEQAVALRLPLTIVKVPAVNVDIIRRWLRDRGRTTPLPDDPRDLMGCLVAQHGQGIAFASEVRHARLCNNRYTTKTGRIGTSPTASSAVPPARPHKRIVVPYMCRIWGGS